MDQGHFTAPGDLVPPEDLTFPRARELTRFLGKALNPYAQLKECRVVSHRDGLRLEIVVLEVDVELPQRRVHDIRHRERLAVIFPPGGKLQPEVLALRSDFPVGVPHLNQRDKGLPRSLCLYDLPYHEIKLHLTAASLVERIRYWLAQTAKGQLHGADQPLEPLLFDPAEDLIVPEDLLERNSDRTPRWLNVYAVQTERNRYTLIATPEKNSTEQQDISWVLLVLSCEPRAHGIIHHTPLTIVDLHELTSASGLDLITALRDQLKEWMQDHTKDELQRVLDARLILLVRLPKTRKPGGPVEAVELRAFVTHAFIKDVGVDVGVWELRQGKPGLLLAFDDARRGATTRLYSVNPRPAFSRSQAARANAAGTPVSTRITAIGVGALGSQVVFNLVRAGFGEWTLIDHDVLLPHNLARHALDGSVIGYPKAWALAGVLNKTIEGDDVAQSIVANVLRPEQNADRVQSALSGAEVILDMSASIPVARYLCRDVDARGRRISLFLNPSGTALTLLAEDKDRRTPLDVLEMRFYREVAANPLLKGLLESPGTLRTGQSCRDVSVQIPQDLVALHAAIGSRALRDTIQSDHARICTWRVETNSFAVRAVEIEPAQAVEQRSGIWRISMDARVPAALAELRHERLPRETGGVLIGSFDMDRRIVYVLDVIPSPPDSEEWPTMYIRGSKGLTRRVTEIQDATDHMLQYVGEWHSHPDGFGTAPSSDDLKVLGWLAEIMDLDGLPGIMGIVGDNGRLALYLCGQAAGDNEL